jgi:hypothetical protein
MYKNTQFFLLIKKCGEMMRGIFLKTGIDILSSTNISPQNKFLVAVELRDPPAKNTQA